MIFSDGAVDVSFGDGGMEKLLSSLSFGDTLSAADLLTVVDGESEENLEEVLTQLVDTMHVTLDITGLSVFAADSQAVIRLRQEEQLVKQGSLLQALEETDPLRLYLEEVAAIPAYGDVAILAEEMCHANQNKTGEASVHTRVMNLCLSRVVQLAQAFVGRGVLLMDLIQEGSMGLWHGLQEMTEYANGAFESCRDWWICQYMAKAVIMQAHIAGVGSKMRETLEDYRMVDEKLLAELGRNPTLEEMAAALHMPVAKAAEVAEMLENARMLQRVKSPKPTQLPQEEDQAVEDTAYFQMRQRITELLSVLSEEEIKLLTLRYGLENGRPMTSQQAGQALGMTPEEVNQKEAAALAKLRERT